MGQNALKGPSETNLPDNIGPYRIKKDAVNTHNGLLAVGGEAALFVAILEDPRLPQPVQKHIEFVIKQAREGISGASERLVCQGRWQMTLSASRNPHIEPVLEVMEGSEKTPARYLMQRADYDLSTYIDQVLSFEEGKQRSHIALQIGFQIAKGLASIQRFAVEHGYHSSDIVHRDLKPANILLRRNAHSDIPLVTITDFNGIAGKEEALEHSLSSHTEAVKSVIETLLYMSPEQELIIRESRKKDQIDQRSDIFSLGLILVEMLGGTHSRRKVDLPADVEPAVKDIINTCLADDPSDRFQTAEELVSALQKVICERVFQKNKKSLDDKTTKEYQFPTEIPMEDFPRLIFRYIDYFKALSMFISIIGPYSKNAAGDIAEAEATIDEIEKRLIKVKKQILSKAGDSEEILSLPISSLKSLLEFFTIHRQVKYLHQSARYLAEIFVLDFPESGKELAKSKLIEVTIEIRKSNERLLNISEELLSSISFKADQE